MRTPACKSRIAIGKPDPCMEGMAAPDGGSESCIVAAVAVERVLIADSPGFQQVVRHITLPCTAQRMWVKIVNT